MLLIDRQKNLELFCDQLRSVAAPVAIDTEFISERRYFARLCLVQVRAENGDEAVEALIDPLSASRLDLAPLLDIVSDAAIIKLVHAGGQDLQILFQEYGCVARNVFDTQIAAAFLGYGHQAGYADLVRRVAHGPQLSKDMQLTDWAARPLSPAQMEYAIADVRYLTEIYTKLHRDLKARGRLEWAETEFRRAEIRATETAPADELYQKFNLSGLSRRQLATLREVAATRDALARSIDKPPSFIMPDPVLLQMAKHPPNDAATLRSTRGMPGLSQTHTREVMAAIQRAADMEPSNYPERGSYERPDPQIENVAALLGIVIQLRAGQHDISRTYLAPREQVMTLASWWLRRDGSTPPDMALLSDWRRELVGAELLELLDGRMTIALDAAPGQPAIKVLKIPG